VGLPLQTVLTIQHALCSSVSLDPSWGMSACTFASTGCTAPPASTSSRAAVELPQMLPSAHSALLQTCSSSTDNAATHAGITPAFIVCFVWCSFPDSRFVRAHSASSLTV